MSSSAIMWLIFNIISIIILAFYSMLEMACVSFNKIRLQYYVSKGYTRALWLNDLLQNPSRLFGTTLIGVNIALVVGSECSREFYEALGLNPNLAPLTQVFIVVIFGELAPMFAARHYPEHVAMLGIPLIYASAKLMEPLLKLVSLVSKACNYLMKGTENDANIYLTQDELQKILEESADDKSSVEAENMELGVIAANIFSLRRKDVRQIMEPLNKSHSLPANATINQMEHLLKSVNVTYIPIYNHEVSNIVAIAYPRDALRATGTRRVRDYARPPWFVSDSTTMMQILKQFRTNNESVAVILNKVGKAVGLIHLDDILAEIFGKLTYTDLKYTPHNQD